MSRIKQVQDYLSELEEFLKKTLQDEKLSAAAQIRRRYLLDRFYALELQANDDRNPLGSKVSHNRPVVLATTLSTAKTNSDEVQKESISRTSEFPESVYNLYEEPVIYSKLENYEGDVAIPTASIAQAEDCSDTEYESFDEEETDSRVCEASYHDNRPTRDVPLPQAKKNSGSELNLLSRLPNVHHSGHLYQKGLLSWLKRFCIISGSRLLTFRSRKHLRPLLVLDLIGCDVEYASRETSKYKHALKISRPTPGEGQVNLGPLSSSVHSSTSDISNCWFYARDREAIDKWTHYLCLSGCLKVSDSKVYESTGEAVTAETDSGVCALACDNQTNISGGSSEGGSGDGVTTSLTASSASSNVLERKPSNSSSLGTSVPAKKKLKLGESLQSLIWGQFNRTRKDDKDDKIKRAFIEAGGLESEVSHLAGYININSDFSSEGLGRWTKKFCVARQTRLDCYKDPLEENIQFSVPLRNSILIDIDRTAKRICLSCEVLEERVEATLEMFNLNDFNKWLVLIYKETDRYLINEGVYNEVYDWKVYSTANDIQPPPLPKERPQSKVLSSSIVSEGDSLGSNNYSSSCNSSSSGNSSIYEQYSMKGLSSIAEDSFLASDFIHKDDSFHLEEIMASAFDDIKRNLIETNDPPVTTAASLESMYMTSKSQPSVSSVTSFSPLVSASTMRQADRSCGELASKYPTFFSVTSSSLSQASSVTSVVSSPSKPSPTYKARSEVVPKVSTDASPTKSYASKGLRSSSVPRSNMLSNGSVEAGKNYLPSCYVVTRSSMITSKPISHVVTTSNQNNAQSNFDFSIIKNELNKRHSIINYNLSSVSTSTATMTSSIILNNNFNWSMNNNIYFKPDKVAGSFIGGHDTSKPSKPCSHSCMPKVFLSASASLASISSSESKTGSMSFISSSSSSSSSSVVSSSIFSSSLANLPLVSKALTAKLSTTSNAFSSSSPVSSTSSNLSLPSSPYLAMTKLSSKTTSPVLSMAVRRSKPMASDLRVVAASNRTGTNITDSDLVSKRASLIALSALSTSNSKLREARAEIRKSSLELMSMLPNTSNKLAVEKTLSTPVTSATGNDYVSS